MELLRSSMADDYRYLSDKIQNVEEVKNSLLYATIPDLKSANLRAREELRRRDEEVAHLRELLASAVNERDNALAQCRFQKQLLLQMQLTQNHNQKTQSPPSPAALLPSPTTVTGNHAPLMGSKKKGGKRGKRSIDSYEHYNGSDSEESASTVSCETVVEPTKPLPEKGRLLEAVIEAGPLLQTLILAGPLPQWRHPPPSSMAIEIPPVLGIESSPQVDYPYPVIRPFK